MFCNRCHAGSSFVNFPVVKQVEVKSENGQLISSPEMRICPQCRIIQPAKDFLESAPFPPPGTSSLHKRGKDKKQHHEKQSDEAFHNDVAEITGGSVRAVDLSKIAPNAD